MQDYWLNFIENLELKAWFSMGFFDFFHVAFSMERFVVWYYIALISSEIIYLCFRFSSFLNRSQSIQLHSSDSFFNPDKTHPRRSANPCSVLFTLKTWCLHFCFPPYFNLGEIIQSMRVFFVTYACQLHDSVEIMQFLTSFFFITKLL